MYGNLLQADLGADLSTRDVVCSMSPDRMHLLELPIAHGSSPPSWLRKHFLAISKAAFAEASGTRIAFQTFKPC
jgi:hypothetical protein